MGSIPFIGAGCSSTLIGASYPYTVLEDGSGKPLSWQGIASSLGDPEIRAQAPDTNVLILTMHESEEYFFQALRAGVAGYLVKKAAPR